MSSTSNVQNLLSNVFRPTFVYDTINSNYQSKLELINIDTVSANTITAFAANVRDSSSNAYIGGGAGNPNSALATSSNVNNTFVGTNAGAGSQNVSNGVLIGYLAASPGGGIGSISIGADTINGGNSNIYIGYGTGISAGNNNIFIGPGIVPASNTSNTLIIGNGGTPTIIGDLVGHRVGINMSNLPVTTPSLSLDVDGYMRIQNGGLGINKLPGSYTLDVNGDMQVSDGYGVLTFTHDVASNSVTTISNTSSYPNCNATLQVTGGFFSRRGSVAVSSGSPQTIGQWKIGTVLISVQSGVYYAARMYTCVEPGTPVIYAMTNAVEDATTTITASGNNIQITSSLAGPNTFTYVITYFPLGQLVP
jgi:hypothetical protein